MPAYPIVALPVDKYISCFLDRHEEVSGKRSGYRYWGRGLWTLLHEIPVRLIGVPSGTICGRQTHMVSLQDFKHGVKLGERIPMSDRMLRLQFRLLLLVRLQFGVSRVVNLPQAL